jgi:FkbM family methyltransferase
MRRRRELRRRVGFYRQFVSRGGLCFDVGANRGDRVELLLAVPARVVAVEPQSSCHPVLRERFGHNPRFALVMCALGAEPGEAELLVADDAETSMLATLSRDWALSVKASGRFAERQWERLERVEVRTLDSVIGEYGVPEFCKIDVEGYEPEVLTGLSTPVVGLSFEFTPERSDRTEECVALLTDLAAYEFNYSLNESLVLASERWLSGADVLAALSVYRGDSRTFGDVYARLVLSGTP